MHCAEYIYERFLLAIGRRSAQPRAAPRSEPAGGQAAEASVPHCMVWGSHAFMKLPYWDEAGFKQPDPMHTVTNEVITASTAPWLHRMHLCFTWQTAFVMSNSLSVCRDAQ